MVFDDAEEPENTGLELADGLLRLQGKYSATAAGSRLYFNAAIEAVLRRHRWKTL